ncbi:hypothetical protein BC834DRAFT_971943 [Gloeopeniophorella convolvens]|nr:hypothetical protein BC834DRAFT_971943 [Gloeopeniophorella convolvens]
MHRRSRRICVFLLLSALAYFLVLVLNHTGLPTSNSLTGGPPNALAIGALDYVNSLLDDALQVAFLYEKDSRAHSDVFPEFVSPITGDVPAASLDVARAQLCQTLRGRTVYLVGSQEPLYQVHTHLLGALQPSGSKQLSCPVPSLCPFNFLCEALPHPSGSAPLAPADVAFTNASLMRFVHSITLYPSPDPEDPRYNLPHVDPRTGVRVIESRWSRQASKASVVILNRGPLPAPAYSYNASEGDLTWLVTLRAREREHSEPLSSLFASLLSRIDALPVDSDAQRLANSALHSTISIFLPSLILTLDTLRRHAGYRSILGRKPVLWYGTWFVPPSCAPDVLSVFAFEYDNPLEPLAALLTHAERMRNPWNAYYNAQVYMHDRLLARLLPLYGVFYLPPMPTNVGMEADRTRRLPIGTSKDWTCVRDVFSTPRGAVMGQDFLQSLATILNSWDWDKP